MCCIDRFDLERRLFSWTIRRGALSGQLDVFKLVAERLERAGIAYMVSSSMTLNYYAQPRLTRDIDLVVERLHPSIGHISNTGLPNWRWWNF